MRIINADVGFIIMINQVTTTMTPAFHSQIVPPPHEVPNFNRRILGNSHVRQGCNCCCWGCGSIGWHRVHTAWVGVRGQQWGQRLQLERGSGSHR